MKIHADGQTDDAPAIQAALDAGEPVVLPPGDVAVYRPPVMTLPGAAVVGDPFGRTRVSPWFASGPGLLAQPPRPLPYTFGPSLAPGPGRSALAPQLLLDTEPRLAAMGGKRALTVAYFLRRESPSPDYGAAHVHCGSDYAGNPRDCWAVWDRLNRLTAYWDGHEMFAPGGVGQQVGVTYFVALTFDGSRVRLLLGQPGGTLSAVVDQVAPTPAVPSWTNGMDPVAVGFNPIGPFGQTRGVGPPDAWMDGFEFAPAVTYNPGDPVPAAKPSPRSNDGVVINWETDGPFVVGRTLPGFMNTGACYYVPQGSRETQGGPVRVADLEFWGNRGASGPCFYDTIMSRADRVNHVGAWQGFSLRGSTYGGRFVDVGGVCGSVLWLQVGQSESTVASGIGGTAGGCGLFTAGSVGGAYTGVNVAPAFGVLCSVYVNGSSEVGVFGGQVDDEGQTGPVTAAAIVENGRLSLYNMLATRSTPGPVVLCANGGWLVASGGWLSAPENSPELIRFVGRDPGHVSHVAGAITPRPVPLTNRPDLVLFERLGQLYIPAAQVPAD